MSTNVAQVITEPTAATIADMNSKLDQILSLLTRSKDNRESLTVAEVAKLVDKSAYTVRQWCNEGRVNASKTTERRGKAGLWRISSDEIVRYKEEGLLDLNRARNFES